MCYPKKKPTEFTMALPLLPVGAAILGMAILSELFDQRPKRVQRSIEACVADVSAMWVKQDGVLRVYHETSNVACGCIVVECNGEAPIDLPGEVEGHQVLIRVNPEADQAPGATEP
jgi:hypothetical protein